MRNNWTLTRAETILLIAGMTFIAGGAVWAAGLGRLNSLGHKYSPP